MCLALSTQRIHPDKFLIFSFLILYDINLDPPKFYLSIFHILCLFKTESPTEDQAAVQFMDLLTLPSR